MFLDKEIALFEDLREYCADKAADPDASDVWARYAAALDTSIEQMRKELRAYHEEKPTTWFGRIKACQSPEEMAKLLDQGGAQSFCPHDCEYCGVGEATCHSCIAAWLDREAYIWT